MPYQREFDDDMLSYQREPTMSSYWKGVKYRNMRSDTRKIAILWYSTIILISKDLSVQTTVNLGDNFFPVQIISSSKPLLFGHTYTPLCAVIYNTSANHLSLRSNIIKNTPDSVELRIQ